MKWTDRFIERPVLAIVVTLVIAIAGLQATRSLSVRQYPKLESSTVTIRTAYIGASAELVSGFVTTPIERAVAATDGVDFIESQSVQGLSLIHARLKLNQPVALALADITARVNQVRADLPPEAEVPAINSEVSDAQVAAMYLSFGSRLLADNQVTDYLLRVVQPRLSAVPGVQRAEILGGRTFALRAWLKPERMAALSVTPAEVRRALAANNYLAAVGQSKGQLVEFDLTASTDLHGVDDFKRLVIRQQNGRLVRLEDIAEVALGAESYEPDVRMSGHKAVFMGVWVQPNANSLDVIARVRAELDALARDAPEGLESRVAFDATEYIRSAIHEVTHTLLETVAIVVLVIFLFLGSLRSVLVPVVTIPVSLVGAFLFVQILGFSVNLLTLLAIVLAVGLVVDDAIVVVENVQRHVRAGHGPLDAARLGARELTSPIIGMTLTLAVVYVPIGLQSGLRGALFREFVFTLVAAVLVSGVVALTLSPMMCSRLVARDAAERGVARLLERGFAALRAGYARALAWTLRTRPLVYAAWLALAVAIVPLYVLSPAELAPNEDQSVVFSAVDVPANATLEQLAPDIDRVERAFRSVPEFDSSFQVTYENGGFGGAVMKPWDARARSIFPIQAELNRKLADVPGLRVSAFLPAALPSAGTFPVEFVIASTDTHARLVRYADELVADAAKSGEFAFPPSADVHIDRAARRLVVDRDKAAALGLTMQTVGADLSALLSGSFVNRLNIDGRSYKVIPELERVARLVPEQVLDLRVSGPNGSLVPLASIAGLRAEVEPRSLNRFQQLNAVKISGVPTRSVDQALRVLESSARRVLPAGYRVDYSGESRQLRTEGRTFLPALGLALVLVFLALAVQFNSFRDPLVVLAGSVPLALFGALLFTFLKFSGPPGLEFPLTRGFTTTLNIYSEVGLVTLVGLIARNGILIVQFANRRQAEGATKLEAVQAAAVTRLRPILMTSAATVVGHFPLTLVHGPGAAARNSIGIVLVGGMAIGTLLTLFVVPSLYVLLARDYRRSASGSEHPFAEASATDELTLRAAAE